MKKTLIAIILLILFPLTSSAALLFGTATSDYVSIAPATAINNLDPFTYWCWIYSTNTQDNGRVMSHGNDNREYIDVANKMRLYVSRATQATVIDSATSFSDNVWTFVAATYSGGTVNHYIGTLTSLVKLAGNTTVLAGSGTITDDTANSLYIGNRSTGTLNRSFGGRIAVCGYENAALTLGNLRVKQFFPVRTSSTVGLWILGYNRLTNVPDYSGNRNTGTISGARLTPHVPLGR